MASGHGNCKLASNATHHTITPAVLHESRSLDRRISALLISPIAVFIRAIGATLGALIATFCRLDKSLSWEKGWLVGAVGIEPLP